MNYALIIAILLVFGILSTRLVKIVKLPNVTAFLITGLLIGCIFIIMDSCGYSSAFHQEKLATSLDKINSFVSSIALGFIALSIGNEFKLNKIKKQVKVF